jgi:hypothetical protein
MLKTRPVRKTFYIAPEDDRAILAIQEKYGLSTHSDCVRLALRLLAESPIAHLPAKRKGRAQ